MLKLPNPGDETSLLSQRNLGLEPTGPFLFVSFLLFGHISGRIILFVCSKRRRLEARNFAVILIYIPFTTYEKNSFTELAGRSFTNGFSGPKCFRDFRETGPRARRTGLRS